MADVGAGGPVWLISLVMVSLMRLCLLSVSVSPALGFTESAVFSVVTVGLHRSASFVGVLLTAQGVGAIAGGLAAAALLKRTSESLLIVGALCALVAGMLLLTIPNLAANLVGIGVAGLVAPWILAGAMTALQVRTPPELLGRVTGVFQLSLGIPQIASLGLGAALIAVVNYRILLAVVAAVALYLLSVPETRRHATADAPVTEPALAPDTPTAVP
jgi:MFS family permease